MEEAGEGTLEQVFLLCSKRNMFREAEFVGNINDNVETNVQCSGLDREQNQAVGTHM